MKPIHSRTRLQRRLGVAASLLLVSAATHAQFSTPNISTAAGAVTNSLGATTVINRGLVAVGHISASALDTFGESFGSASSMRITGWTNRGDGSYTGTLNILPDRGYNIGGFYADYAARINQAGFTLKPYTGSSGIGGSTDLEKLQAQTNQLSFGSISGVPFTYLDPVSGALSVTTGLDPGTNTTTLFGKPAPYVRSYVGAQSPSATNLTTYTGINKLPLDSEALILRPDGSGYVGDEYGPIIYYFNPSKQIIGSIVPPAALLPHLPAGVLNFTSAGAPVNGRRNNQGFEGVSLSPDGTRLFALLQSAAVQDSLQSANDQNAVNTRLLIYDVSVNPTPASPIAEYALALPSYTGNGRGGAVNKTCAQSEVVALDNYRFLVLSRDGNGLGNSSPNPNVFKSVLLVDTRVGTPVNFVTDAARNAEGGLITTAPGVLDPAIKPLSWVEAVNLLNSVQLGKFNVTIDNGTNQVTKLTMGEKWEGMALVPAYDPSNPDDYFLFVGNDNDFLTSNGRMRGPDGTIVSYNGFAGYPANRVPAALDSANSENDTRILVFRLTIQNSLPGIDHIIVVYQENWSFDSLYGSFPGANGIANATGLSLTQMDRLSGSPISLLANYDPASSAIPIQIPPAPLNGTQDLRFILGTNVDSPTLENTLAPYDLVNYVSATNLTGDIVHRYWQEQYQIDHGKMDQFITWSDNPGLVMSHYDSTVLPEGLLASQYVLCDNFFHSAFGGSYLNHQFLIAASAPVYPNAAAIIPASVAALDSKGQLLLFTTNTTFLGQPYYTNNATLNGRIFRDGSITPIGGAAFANTNVAFDQNYSVNTTFSINLANAGNGVNPNATSFIPSQNDSNPSDPIRPYHLTIGDRMDAAGVSWKWYSGGFSNALDSSPTNPKNNGASGTTVDPLFQWHHQPFVFFDNYAPWTNGVRNARSAAHLQDENDFFADVANNTVPQVVFIKPIGADNEHPGYASPMRGQMHVSNIVAAVKSNPGLWAHTAIIITYDEHGGHWDHVAPPARDIWGPGSRVPAIIVSPYAKTHTVDHNPYETLSILKTIETRFGVAPINAADASAPSLAPAFNATPAPDTATTPALTAQVSGSAVGLSWPGGYSGYVVQSSTNLAGGEWTTIYSGTTNMFNLAVDPKQPAIFYRLIHP